MKSLAYCRFALALTVMLSGVLVPGIPQGCLLLALAACGVLDVVVNDWLCRDCPGLPVCAFLAKHRSITYTGLSAACIAAMLPLSSRPLTWWTVALFAQSTAAVLLACADTHVRYVRPRKLT